MDGFPIAYFLTFTCYGTRLPGDERGWVDPKDAAYEAPLKEGRPPLLNYGGRELRQQPYLLDEARRTIVQAAIAQICVDRGWELWSSHVRTNHVHLIVSAPSKPERILTEIKARASRLLNEAALDGPDRLRWTRHGSTRYLWDNTSVEQAIRYVRDQQGTPLSLVVDESVAEME